MPQAAKISPPPVLQPKAEKKPDAQLPEWKPGGSGAVSPLQRLIDSKGAQAKLTIGQPNDRYEQEADAVAKQVVQRLHSPVSESPQQEMVQRETLEEEPEDKLQMKPVVQRVHAVGGEEAASPDIENSINRAKGGGQPLDAGLQRSMGQAMGADFSGVRVHTDTQSDQLNRSIQAKAFTTGQDVFFKKGEYQPGSKGGQKLIAHELTHVVQQGQAKVQRKLAPEDEAQLQKLIEEEEKEKKIQKTPDDPIQRSLDPAQGSLIQRQGKSTYKVEDGGDVTAVTRSGGFGWTAGLTKHQKTRLLDAVKNARTWGTNSAAKIAQLKTAAETATTWKDIDELLREPFERNFSGFNENLTELRPYIDQVQTAISRTNAGLAQPVKIVENKPDKEETPTDVTLGYVKKPGRRETDGTWIPRFQFLDETVYPTSIHINFARLLVGGKERKAATTIFHEGTHKFTHTDDKVGYGSSLAYASTIDKTVTNADCYAWYVSQTQ